MPNMTQTFRNHPLNFLQFHPLLISIFPDATFDTQTVHFDINTSDYTSNSVESVIDNTPCELKSTSDTEKLKAYWLPYKPDFATSLQLGSDANFMFTANMDGCTFAATHSRTSPRVSHSNAATIGGIINQYLNDPQKSALAQKAIQQCSASRILGLQKIKYQNSRSRDCTTIVGIRDITTGSWRFCKQVIGISNYGQSCTVKSVTPF
ncbi:hypothetical protein [Microbulbifer rhizosphaerae]|uniref:Uncharacterized protein n=1 Tax=Microbulbifer rhizosphaerae TaxID=1562603 RepID=A0A7W4WAK9_9GAMM|nr:hypothetical protein [Microbulbifer rhizosphaerae]MBB3060694.1 hypothetical protein [Microbulbifer rhizosphaerae]